MLLQQRVIEFTERARTPEETAFLRLQARQEVLTTQVEKLNDAREELADDLNQRTGTDREGIESRIKQLDGQIQQAQTDLMEVTKQLANAAPASVADQVQTVYRGFNDEDMVAAGFAGAAIMFALFLPFMIRNFFRRRRAGATGTTTIQVPSIAAERIDRMEQSIDSIAVEIERVSENQRFMTRLMTETQLAGTIAAVRGSTEAAKVAAEKASNV
jgi:hypothetical protein